MSTSFPYWRHERSALARPGEIEKTAAPVTILPAQRHDRALFVDHTERPQDPHHAGGNRPAVSGAQDQLGCEGADRARIPEDQSERQDTGHHRYRWSRGRFWRQATGDL